MSVNVRDTLSGGQVEVGEDGRIGLYVCGRLLSQMHGRIHLRRGAPGFSVAIELPEAA